MREIHTEHIKTLIKEIPSFYKVEQVLQRFHLLTSAVDKGEQYLLCCPFHEDADPSFRIMKRTGIWNCFSCGQSGTLLKLIHRLSVTSLSFYDFADNLLRSDKLLQNTLGFNTIYRDLNDFSNNTDFEPFKRFKPSKTADLPITVLSDYLQRKEKSFDTLKASLSMIQQDISIMEIKRFYEEYWQYSSNKEKVKEISLQELLI